MTLDEVMREIRQKITCVSWDSGTVRAANICPTGEEYVAFCSGGIKKEGDQMPCLCLTPEVAVHVWRTMLLEYAVARPGILYWREEPEIDREPGGRYAVYSRMWISERPPKRWDKKLA